MTARPQLSPPADLSTFSEAVYDQLERIEGKLDDFREETMERFDKLEASVDQRVRQDRGDTGARVRPRSKEYHPSSHLFRPSGHSCSPQHFHSCGVLVVRPQV